MNEIIVLYFIFNSKTACGVKLKKYFAASMINTLNRSQVTLVLALR